MLQYPHGGGILMTGRATEPECYLTDFSFEKKHFLPGSYFFEESYVNAFEKQLLSYYVSCINRYFHSK